MLSSEQALREYRWSSWPEYLKPPKGRWPWLRVNRLLGEYGVPKDSPAGRRYLEQCLEERRSAEETQDYKRVRRGWCLGGKPFKKALLEQMAGGMGALT